MASDIASFINQNKWDYVTPFLRLWKKYDSEHFTKCEQSNQSIVTDKYQEAVNALGQDSIQLLQQTSNSSELISNITTSLKFY